MYPAMFPYITHIYLKAVLVSSNDYDCGCFYKTNAPYSPAMCSVMKIDNNSIKAGFNNTVSIHISQ